MVQASIINSSSIQAFMDCSPQSMGEIMQRFVLSVGKFDLQYDGNATLTVNGAHFIMVPLVPAASNEIGGSPVVQPIAPNSHLKQVLAMAMVCMGQSSNHPAFHLS